MHPHCIRTLLALLAILACSAAHAAIPAFDGYAAASDEELDKMRGGFEFNVNGMQLTLAFSLERLTYINGELVSSMKLTPLQLITPGAAPEAPAVGATGLPPPVVTTQLINNQTVVTLVQNGKGNAFTLPQSLSSLNTVIQKDRKSVV